MSRSISAKAVKMVLRSQAHIEADHANDLVAQMRQVDRNLKKQREQTREHGRQVMTSAMKRARRRARQGGNKAIKRHDSQVAQASPAERGKIWIPR
jgi:N-methylhydantoinase B/oxoprolinase/acetone carboxylase alpha subunit